MRTIARQLPTIATGALAVTACIALPILVWQWIAEVFAGGVVTDAMQIGQAASAGLVSAMFTGAFAWTAWRRQVEDHSATVGVVRGELESAEALLSTVMDQVPVGLLVLDDQRHVRHANELAMRLHGADRLDDAHCSTLITGCRSDCEDCPIPETLLEGVAASSEQLTHDPRTGEVVRRSSHPLTFADGVQGALVIEKVVTEEQRMEATLLHQEKMAAFGLLAAGIAHDMGNPLASMEMHLQLLDSQDLSDEAAESTGVVREEAARLRRSLRELVDFARRRSVDRTLVSVQSVAEGTLAILKYDPRMRSVKVTHDWDSETPAVEMVEDHLVQVVLNLLLNALDAMPDGGYLHLDLRAIDDEVVLRIKDTGTGMDAAVLARCCEPLFSTKAPGKGTGLGLAVGRDIIREAGGDLEVHSAPGKGTMVIVRLPSAEARSGARPQLALVS